MSSQVTANVLDVSPEARAQLQQIVRMGPANLARRARIILSRAEGTSLNQIAQTVGMHRDSVRRWILRFRARGLAGLRHGNAGKPKNVVFHAAIRAEIARRAGLPPWTLGESFPTWSLYKLRDHLIRSDVVRAISVERLRQLLHAEPYSREHWNPAPVSVDPLPDDVRHQLVSLVRHSRSEQARWAEAVLAIADGNSVQEVATKLHLDTNNLRRWLDHFRMGGAGSPGTTEHSPSRTGPRPSSRRRGPRSAAPAP